MKNLQQDDAFALPMVLAILIIIASIFAIINWNIRETYQQIEHKIKLEKTHAELWGAANILIYSGLANNNITIDDKFHEITIETNTYWFKIIPSTGLIDINFAPPELLLNALIKLGANEKESSNIVEDIVNFRGETEPDSYGKIHFKPIRDIAELSNISSVTNKSIQCIENYFTVDSGLPQPYDIFSPRIIKEIINNPKDSIEHNVNHNKFEVGNAYIIYLGNENDNIRLVFRIIQSDKSNIIYHDLEYNVQNYKDEQANCFQ